MDKCKITLIDAYSDEAYWVPDTLELQFSCLQHETSVHDGDLLDEGIKYCPFCGKEADLINGYTGWGSFYKNDTRFRHEEQKGQ